MLIALLLSCAKSCAKPAETEVLVATPQAPGVGARGTLPTVCEASALLVAGGRILLADNEAPSRIYALSRTLDAVTPVELGSPIDDIEALAGTGDDLWVVGSQSANKDAEPRPEREAIVRVQGGVTTRVRPDLSVCAPCEAVRTKAPKDGGLNVEGAAVVGGQLWLGARSPLVDGKAILLPMSGSGDRAVSMVLVDLGGQGIRELVSVGTGMLVLSGPLDDRTAPHRLWWMASPGGPATALPGELPPHTEGVALVDGQLWWVSDGDGKPGKCKSPAGWGIDAPPALP